MTKLARQDAISLKMDEHALALNEQFGELDDDGKVASPDSRRIEPAEPENYQRPSDETIRGLVRRGVEALRRRH